MEFIEFIEVNVPQKQLDAFWASANPVIEVPLNNKYHLLLRLRGKIEKKKNAYFLINIANKATS